MHSLFSPCTEEMLVDYVTTVGNIFLRAVLSSFVVASLCEEVSKTKDIITTDWTAFDTLY